MSSSLLVVWIILGLGLLMAIGLAIVVVSYRRPSGREISKPTATQPEKAKFAIKLDALLNDDRRVALSDLLPQEPKERTKALEDLQAEVRRAAGGPGSSAASG